MLPFPLVDTWLKAFKTISYDDASDRLSYYATSFCLLFFAVLISAKQTFGSPIQCWVPAQWRSSWEQYAEDYCFITNTYWLHPKESIPTQEKAFIKTDHQINYYQWVPVVLCMQALMFYLPSVIWRSFSFQSGICLRSILAAAKISAKESKKESRTGGVRELAVYLVEQLDARNQLRSANRSWNPFLKFSSISGAFVTAVYMFTKVLYLVNIFVQFHLLNQFLGVDFVSWGWKAMRDALNGRDWVQPGHFPRVTMCDMGIRELGADHEDGNKTIQCVLMINVFSEKIYLFLWGWFILVGAVTLANLIYWLLTQFMPGSKRMMVERLVYSSLEMQRCHGYNLSDEKKDSMGRRPVDVTAYLDHFVSDCLRDDGVLILRFIQGHAGDLLVISLVYAMIEEYQGQKERKALVKSPPMPSTCATSASSAQPMFDYKGAFPAHFNMGTLDKPTEPHGPQATLRPSRSAGYFGGQPHQYGGGLPNFTPSDDTMQSLPSKCPSPRPETDDGGFCEDV